MRIRSRDFLRRHSPEKSLKKDGTTLCQQSFNFTATKYVITLATKDLFLEFVKCFITFVNKRYFVLVPSSPVKLFSYFRILC